MEAAHLILNGECGVFSAKLTITGLRRSEAMGG